MSPLDEARALVGGDGPAAERVAAVVAERDDLRARLAAYESASAEASTETLAALDALDAVAGMECDGPEEALSNQQARAIREHLRWLTTRYQREHVGRERAEMQRDVARTERDVLEMQLADQRAAAREARSQRDLAMTWGRVIVEGAAWAAMGRRAERLTEQLMRDEIAASWRAERDAALERGVRLGLEAAAQGLEAFAYIDAPAIVRRLTPAAIIAAAREREAAPQETAGAFDRLWGSARGLVRDAEEAERPRAELGETDAGEGE
jgi:hypothetical protein